MSVLFYRATVGMCRPIVLLYRTSTTSLTETWYYASGLKRLRDRRGAERLPPAMELTVGAPAAAGMAAAILGAAGIAVGIGTDHSHMVESGINAIAYGGGGGLAGTLGVLNLYSHWKAGQYDYQLEQKKHAAALPAPPTKSAFVLK